MPLDCAENGPRHSDHRNYTAQPVSSCSVAVLVFIGAAGGGEVFHLSLLGHCDDAGET